MCPFSHLGTRSQEHLDAQADPTRKWLSSEGNQTALCSPRLPSAFLSRSELALDFKGLLVPPPSLIVNPPFWFKQTFERIAVGGEEERG